MTTHELPCELCRGDGYLPEAEARAAGKALGCYGCVRGFVLTVLGLVALGFAAAFWNFYRDVGGRSDTQIDGLASGPAIVEISSSLPEHVGQCLATEELLYPEGIVDCRSSAASSWSILASYSIRSSSEDDVYPGPDQLYQFGQSICQGVVAAELGEDLPEYGASFSTHEEWEALHRYLICLIGERDTGAAAG